MRPAAGRYRSRAGRRWAAAAARVPACTGTTGSSSTWTHTAPQCRRQQHDQSPLPLSMRCCLYQCRPSADDDAVRAVRVQRVVVAQHGQRPGEQQHRGRGQRKAVHVHGEPQEGRERRTGGASHGRPRPLRCCLSHVRRRGTASSARARRQEGPAPLAPAATEARNAHLDAAVRPFPAPAASSRVQRRRAARRLTK